MEKEKNNLQFNVAKSKWKMKMKGRKNPMKQGDPNSP